MLLRFGFPLNSTKAEVSQLVINFVVLTQGDFQHLLQLVVAGADDTSTRTRSAKMLMYFLVSVNLAACKPFT